jgi:hypothetical protein
VEQGQVTREVVSLSRGSKLAVLAGLLLLIVAGFLLLVPLEKPTNTGAPFGCGTALNPSNGQFPEAVCGGLNRKFQLGAASFGLAALVVGGGGALVFGTVRRKERLVANSQDAPRD